MCAARHASHHWGDERSQPRRRHCCVAHLPTSQWRRPAAVRGALQQWAGRHWCYTPSREHADARRRHGWTEAGQRLHQPQLQHCSLVARSVASQASRSSNWSWASRCMYILPKHIHSCTDPLAYCTGWPKKVTPKNRVLSDLSVKQGLQHKDLIFQTITKYSIH